MENTPLLYSLPVDVTTIANNRALGHKITVSLLPTLPTTTAPRATAQLLWHLNPHTSTIDIRTTTPITSPRVTQHPHPPLPTQGNTVNITVIMTLTKNAVPHVPRQLWATGYRPGRGVPIVAPPEERATLARQRLEKHGLHISAITIDTPMPMPLHPKGKTKDLIAFPVYAQATITDHKKFERLILNGIGKMKNYGAGMVRYKRF